jgi:hypothetical protein
MEEDDMVMRVGNSLEGKRDEAMRREGLQARGAYKDRSSAWLRKNSAWLESSTWSEL